MAALKRRSKAAERLIMALYLYPHYPTGSRGPGGCIVDALDLLHPKAAKAVREGEDLRRVLERFWPDLHPKEQE